MVFSCRPPAPRASGPEGEMTRSLPITKLVDADSLSNAPVPVTKIFSDARSLKLAEPVAVSLIQFCVCVTKSVFIPDWVRSASIWSLVIPKRFAVAVSVNVAASAMISLA